MRAFLLLTLVVAGCKKEAAPSEVSPPAKVNPTSPGPTEVALDGAYHAVRCGDVTAVWAGSADALKDLATESTAAPKSFGVTGLSFRFADGTQQPFTPTGSLTFSDWSFDIFSPDCSHVALLQDRFGPYTLVETSGLRGLVGGKTVKADGSEGAVHDGFRWTSGSAFEFVASSGGGARVLSGDATQATLKTVFEAAEAPRGVRRGASGWEVVK
jgi:hypothetical protein